MIKEVLNQNAVYIHVFKAQAQSCQINSLSKELTVLYNYYIFLYLLYVK